MKLYDLLGKNEIKNEKNFSFSLEYTYENKYSGG